MKVTLIRSPIGKPPRVRKTLVALGLTKMHKTVELGDQPSVQGMVRQVKHLIEVVE